MLTFSKWPTPTENPDEKTLGEGQVGKAAAARMAPPCWLQSPLDALFPHFLLLSLFHWDTRKFASLMAKDGVQFCDLTWELNAFYIFVCRRSKEQTQLPFGCECFLLLGPPNGKSPRKTELHKCLGYWSPLRRKTL